MPEHAPLLRRRAKTTPRRAADWGASGGAAATIARMGGNRAFARAILQRVTYTWTEGRWVRGPGRSRRGARRPDRDGTFEGETYNDSTGIYSASLRRRERAPELALVEPYDEKRAEEDEPMAVEPQTVEAEAAPGTVDDELVAWMASPAMTETQYPRILPAWVRRLAKSDVDLSCWSWALAGFSQTGFHRDTVWGYLTQDETRLHRRRHPLPKWVDELPAAVSDELRAVVRTIGREGLMERPADERDVPDWNAKVEATMRRAVTAIVQGNGFVLASPHVPPAAWIVCHYKLHEGMAVPEHWWIELPGPHGQIIIQTVPGRDVEVGGEDLRWHSASSGDGRGDDAAQYREIRIPVAALLGSHIDFLRRGMNEERAKLERAMVGTSRHRRSKSDQKL